MTNGEKEKITIVGKNYVCGIYSIDDGTENDKIDPQFFQEVNKILKGEQEVNND